MKKNFNSFIGRKEINAPKNGGLKEKQRCINEGSNAEIKDIRPDKVLDGGHANKDSPLKIIGSNETQMVSKQEPVRKDKRQVKEELEDLEEEERKVVEMINKYRNNLDLKELKKDEEKVDISGSSRKKVLMEKQVKKGSSWSEGQRSYYFG
ncbi:unnamed protein product [Rhizophagus irregularis]|uniref:Uncharacterized protein n=1 Tax=Rhizophagus irregularis TaxID=588596 RepID=A0A916E4K9_9GLOM|nr:unnamed protein product [Rhizophagus irregularis]